MACHKIRFKKVSIENALILTLIGFLAVSGTLTGCVAAVPVVVGVAAAGAVAGIVTIVNLARDQYPDIDFDAPAPVETVYSAGIDETWNAVMDTLMEMKESVAMMDKNSGIIRTNRKNLNDVSWIGKGLGKASFLYEYNITVRPKDCGTSVQVMVTFCEEKMFIAAKEKNLPEGSNMMRHIFYRNLKQRIAPNSERFPDSPMQDIRHSPLTRETQPGSTSDHNPQQTNIEMGVAEAQRLLNERGYNAGTPDGKMGPQTRRAIMAFQKGTGLEQTGTLTPETVAKLRH